MSAALALRTLTQPMHDSVDAAFGRFALDSATEYRAFLYAHALALPAAEAALAGWYEAPAWVPRTPLLAADLADLGLAMPAPLGFASPATAAARWGVFYVLEGSRLGGAMLARQVGEGLPRRTLAAAHGPGGWRAVRAAIDAAATSAGPTWQDAAADAATACFALYARAADLAALDTRPDAIRPGMPQPS